VFHTHQELWDKKTNKADKDIQDVLYWFASQHCTSDDHEF